MLHDPEVVVLDEPFSGLDPVNVLLVRELLGELKAAGKVVILSTHQMALVEALCDRIAMIHRGRLVLYGPLREIRRAHSGSALLVSGEGAWGSFASVAGATPAGMKWHLTLREGSAPREFLAEALARNMVPDSYEAAEAPLEEIFVKVARGGES